MAVRAATFTGLNPYKLTRVTVTDGMLGHGSYATVLELEYMGLKCAGKKIHELLLEHGDASYTIRRFEEECRLLSQVRHPNIVQFLGVYFQQGVRAPILVMEFLPTSLTSCIKLYGILPKEISYSILHDVALGLCYLHSQTAPIIHRDLSSNNVLLTPNMTAKVSDLGVARILNLTPLHVSHMTQTPGTPTYMPPEVMVANPKYDTSVDEFSYGVMMIHVFSGQWPEPQVGPIRIERGKLIPVTEGERREVFLNMMEDEHPLMNLIHRCVNNDPQQRPHANEIVRRVSQVASQFPSTFTNRLEMLKRIEADTEERRVLTEEAERKNGVIKQKQDEILLQREEIEVVEMQQRVQIAQLDLVHSSEVEQLRLQIKELNTQSKLKEVQSEANLTELKSKTKVLEGQVENNAKTVVYLEAQLAQERDANNRLIVDLQDNILKLQDGIKQRDKNIQMKDASIQIKDACTRRRAIEFDAKSRALEEKDATISAMSEQLTKMREYLATKKQVPHFSLTWRRCAELPTELNYGNSTVIKDKVYCEGVTDDYGFSYTVYCYEPSQDKWTTLPPLPVKYVGLGQVNGNLAAVGGYNKYNDVTNNVYTYDERAQKWRKTIPPMPTARWSPGVLSLQSVLVVAGGNISLYMSDCTAAVEIFKPDSSQWYKTDPLPTACRHISLVAIDSLCYALGGFDGSWFNSVHVFHAAFCKPVPADQTTESCKSCDTQSAWKTLPKTPTYGPSVAVLGGSLLAVGGKESSKGRADMKGVYVYSPSANSWIYVGDLPAPRSTTAVANLSSNEIIVVGGWDGERGVKTVYAGTLTFS